MVKHLILDLGIGPKIQFGGWEDRHKINQAQPSSMLMQKYLCEKEQNKLGYGTQTLAFVQPFLELI